MNSRKKNTDDNQATSFEASLEKLESLVSKMEDGDFQLQEALEAFEHGIKLVRDTQKKITEAEQKVQVLLENNDEMQVRDFTNTEEGE